VRYPQEYIIKLAQLRAWMKARQFSKPRSRYIMRHFAAANRSVNIYNERECLSSLPVGLSRELSMVMYGDILSRSPLFRLLGQELLLQLCQIVEPISVMSGQTIFRKGAIGQEAYFVVRGEFEVTDGMNGNRLGFIGRGGFFGEQTIIQVITKKYGTGGGALGDNMFFILARDIACCQCTMDRIS
jgi:hypothetical protein